MDKSRCLIEVKEMFIRNQEIIATNNVLHEGWDYVRNGMLKGGYTEDEVNILHKELLQIQLEIKEKLDKN